ncbi:MULTISPECIES: class I SAM-dependent methyltransferase [Spirulina sp. CCY15215]|uniref:class I SAM-dependent methyltransferase n=1 Tax=Spirulina sp. CCY15215 TaxID=2767591 RepID=UPI00194FE9E1|nr:class I SAM-dependent methyltransferase [Spirulina major]
MPEIQQKYESQNQLQTFSEDDPFTVERYEQFCRFFPQNVQRVLDVGCNTGRGGERLKTLNPALEIFGLDCVQNRLNALPDAYTGKIYGLSNDIPQDDESFDAIVAGEFLEHLYPSDVDRTLCEFQRILKIKGRLLLTTPHPHYLKNKLTGGTVYGVSHLTQHFPQILKLRLQMHGFSGVKILGSGKLSRYLGYYFPLKFVYGSYLIFGDKY